MTLYMNGKPIGKCVDISESEIIEPKCVDQKIFRGIKDSELTIEVKMSSDTKEKLEKLIEDITIPECILTCSYREALWLFEEAIKSENVKIAKKYPYPTVIYKNGMTSVFVPEISYPAWSLGRRYKLNGVIMRSGYLVKESEEE